MLNKKILNRIKILYAVTIFTIIIELIGIHVVPYIKSLNIQDHINPYNGAWCWFGNSRVVEFKNKFDKIYFGWVTKYGSIRIGSYDLESKEREYKTIKDNFEIDDHDNPSILILPNNHIMIFFSKHCGEYLYSAVSTYPEDISSWDKIKNIFHNAVDKGGITYPKPVLLSKEANTIYLFWRGIDLQPYFSKSIDGMHWEKEKQIIESKGRDPYLKIISNNKDEIFFAFTDGHPADLLPNSIYLFKYKGGKFYSADGKIIGSLKDLPIETSKNLLVYHSKTLKDRSWIWDIALENDSTPVLVYSVFKDSLDHRYYYSKYIDNSWFTTEITKAGKWFPLGFPKTQQYFSRQVYLEKGNVSYTTSPTPKTEYFYSGGIAINHNNPSEIILSEEVKGIFELRKYVTHNNGGTWEKQNITNNSKKNNVRPYIVNSNDNKIEVIFWMQGNYEHFTNFDTNIKYQIY